jgi:3-hydroxyacyl-CoA dehydrogenase
MAIDKVGVVGCGLMGSAIVQVVAQAGFSVAVRERTFALKIVGVIACAMWS